MSDSLPSPNRLYSDVIGEIPALVREIAKSYKEVYEDAWEVERSEALHLAKTDVGDPTYMAMLSKQGKRSDCRRATKRLRDVAKELRAINAHLAASARTHEHTDDDREAVIRSVAPMSEGEAHRLHVEREKQVVRAVE